MSTRNSDRRKLSQLVKEAIIYEKLESKAMNQGDYKEARRYKEFKSRRLIEFYKLCSYQ